MLRQTCCQNEAEQHPPSQNELAACAQDKAQDSICKLSSFRGDGQWLGLSKLAGSDTFVGLCSSGSLFIACLG